jgi:6-pyruvoyl-tetrahydropterin synthase
MTEYTFTVTGTVTVKLQGKDTEKNYQEAIDKAINQARNEIDHDWIIDVTAEEHINETEEELCH